MKDMVMATLTNEFHGTSASVCTDDGGYLTKRQVQRVRDKLCGSADCKCGETELRTRGRQDVEIVPYASGRVRLIARAK